MLLVVDGPGVTEARQQRGGHLMSEKVTPASIVPIQATARMIKAQQ